MIWSTPALKDATIYESDPSRNTGLDQILELKKQGRIEDGDLHESRIAIQFDLSNLNELLSNNSVTINDITASLKLYAVQESEYPESLTIEAKALAHPWMNGAGYLYYPSSINTSLTNTGIDWYNVNGYDSVQWTNVTQSGVEYSYISEAGGGAWYTSSIVSQSFNYKSSDYVSIDVTEIVRSWQSLEIDNNGFLISFTESQISSSGAPNTNLQFYSTETHTIYQPQLYIQWVNQQIYDTGSYEVITHDDDAVIYTISFQSEYQVNSKIRIRIGARPKFPRRIFSQNSNFELTKILPTNSYYQIKDAHTDQILIPYSEYTKINSFEGVEYFDIYTTMMYPERFYKFELKLDFGYITSYITSNDFVFKIIR